MTRIKPRILCVDDNEDTCEMVAIALGLSGIEVIPAHSAEDALRLARADHFDLYLLDGKLPDGTGIEVCKQVRRLGSKAPVIFCSGFGEEFDKRQAMLAGAELYLVKPISIAELVQVVPELLGKSRQPSSFDNSGRDTSEFFD